jgi:hypothetical protein
MAHYAKVVNSLVTQVIVAEPEFFDTFVDTSPGDWIQTSYNTHGGVHYNPETGEPSADQSKALRKNYAGVGYTYNHTLDAFIPPKPYPSFVLDEEKCIWMPPISMPAPVSGKDWAWDEDTVSWIQKTYT